MSRLLFARACTARSNKPSVRVAAEIETAKTKDEVRANLEYHAAKSTSALPIEFGVPEMYQATAQSVREGLVERWNDTYAHFHKENPKQAYYLSMEYLQGRALTNAIGNMGLTGEYSDALRSLGYTLEDVMSVERNAGLGNGGLGRLASCFLDSIATLDLPAWGYGLRYKYGLFKQGVDKATGEQLEFADDWLEVGNPWEVARPQVSYPISFYGKVVDGKWVPGKQVRAVAYDSPIPGYKTRNCISLRMWDAQPSVAQFDLAAFNASDYETSMGPTNLASMLCAVLYPGDGTREGKALRLSQQYMLCSASVQDILARWKERGNSDWSKLHEKVAVQMNDTHPTLAAPELMRILIDEEGLSWDDAWKVTTKTVAYTNHTVMPEALEKWPMDLVEELLPRHMEIIKRINDEFVASVKAKYADMPAEELARSIEAMSILENYVSPEEKAAKKAAAAAAAKKAATAKKTTKAADEEVEEEEKPAMVRMANLCCISGMAINGVAAIHSEIVKDVVFNDFYKLFPEKFQNKTNGVTPRRWLAFANPELSSVVTKWVGSDKWITDTDELRKLADNASNPELQAEWKAAKLARKQICKDYIKKVTDIDVPIDSMFDIQVKRIHEYKRQFLNILGIIYRYKQMKAMTPEERAKCVPRVCIFGGKAYATYLQAKRIVRLINNVGKVVNNDPEIGDLLKVVFVPDYNVSLAETLIPASELSQHISTAGTEASGTSNMKFQMNGCLIIGTLDGANVEIRECVGEDNFFLFGITDPEVEPARAERAAGKFKPDPRFVETLEYVRSGVFGETFEELLGSLEGNEGFGRGDYFLVGKDFASYLEAQERVDEAYADSAGWTESSIISTAFSGKFNSDRTIDQYAKEIWGIQPCTVPERK
jgi:starch phosphorylase